MTARRSALARPERDSAALAQADRGQTRQAILAAARDLAARHGPDGFTLVAVGRAATVSHTTIYNHFENRAHILRALADAWNEGLLDEAERAAGAIGDADAVERIRRLLLALCRAKCRLHAENPRLFEAYLVALEADPLSRDLYLERLAGVIAAMLAADEARLPKGVGADALARALIIATAKFRHGAFIRRIAVDDLARQLDTVFACIIRPLLAPREG